MNFAKRALLALGLIFSYNSVANAEAGGFGFHVGAGVPYVTQAAVIYRFSDKLTGEFSYGILDVDVDTASVSLTKPEVGIKFHPMAGSFYIGAGLGTFTLEAEATDISTGATAKAEVTGQSLTAYVGWLWSIANGGFFIGLDFGYQNPLSSDTTVTVTPTGVIGPGNEEYDDVVEAGEDFGDTAFPVFTALRLGWLF